MWLLVFIPAVAGIWKFRFWTFWKWVGAMFVLQLLTDFLFASSGTLSNPSGDGLITAMIRQTTGDGPEMAILGLVVLGTFLLLTVLIGLRLRNAMRNPPQVAFPSAPASTGRKIAETVALVGLIGGLMFIRATTLMAEYRQPQAAPGTVSRQAASMSLEREVALAAQQINRQYPAKLDDITNLVSVTSSGRVMIYNYEISEQTTEARLRSFIAQTVIPKACEDAQLRQEMERGVSFRYSYTVPNLSEPVYLDATQEVCAAG